MREQPPACHPANAMEPRTDASSPPSGDADLTALQERMRYRAVCLGCGAVSSEMATEAQAMQWKAHHCRQVSVPEEVVIEASVIMPSGTVARFFQHA